jgi:putative NADPH-quinone reductase
MLRRLTIVQGHPDPNSRRLCDALADAHAEGTAAAGHEITRIEVAQLDFPILRTQEEFERSHLPETLVEERNGIVSAQHLVMIFPLWHGTMPALLKAFLEQVMRPGVALEYRKHGFARGLLAGPSARIVVTMGMPVYIQVVLPSPWSARAGTERPQICRDEACPRDPVGDCRRGERCKAAGVARPNESLRQAARLRFPGLARRHYQFPAMLVVWPSGASSPKRLRWSGACSKLTSPHRFRTASPIRVIISLSIAAGVAKFSRTNPP